MMADATSGTVANVATSTEGMSTTTKVIILLVVAGVSYWAYKKFFDKD